MRGIVDTLSELASFAQQNADTFAQGDTMFGPAVEPTRVDLMREFSRLTGVPIHEANFVLAKTLDDIATKRRVETAPESVRLAQRMLANPPIEPAPRFELFTVVKSADGVEHKVWGMNGKPYLTILLEGIDGVEPLPVILQEGTLAGIHIRKHEAELP